MSYFTQAYAAKMFFKLKPDEYRFVDNMWYQICKDGIYDKINKTDGMALNIYDTLRQEIIRIYREDDDDHYIKDKDKSISKIGSVSFIKGVITFLKDLASGDQSSLGYSS